MFSDRRGGIHPIRLAWVVDWKSRRGGKTLKEPTDRGKKESEDPKESFTDILRCSRTHGYY
jgi:hypothetical protein